MELFLKKNKLEAKINKINRNIAIEKSKNNEQKRKERTHKLIKLGALFEISELLSIQEECLLGYLLLFPKNNLDDLIRFKELGSKKMIERIQNRENKKNKKNKNLSYSEKTFSQSDIITLFQISKEKNIDVVRLAQENFKKNLIENLTYNEFHYLKNLVLNK